MARNSPARHLVLRIKKAQGPRPEDVAIPVETQAGEVAQVDFGYVGKIYDPSEGQLRKAWVFVMTLSHSRHLFAEIVFDQRIETWLMLHVQAFAYLGGVPRVLVPDNLKAAVVRAAFGVDEEVVLNRSYRELARHYGFQIDPTPPRSPEKKGKVERSVRYLKGSFFRTWESVDIAEDRRELRRWIEEVAAVRRHGTTGRVPGEVFEKEEREALLALPPRPWQLVTWRRAKLHRDSHVQSEGAFYSAPWRFIGEDLWLRCTLKTVEIHRQDERVAVHGRVARGQRSTQEGHLPEERRDHRHRSRSYWEDRAEAIGAEVLDLVVAIFDSDDVLLQLRKVQAIVRHLEGFPAMRARRAAARALAYSSLEYRSIKSILAKGLDLEPLPEKRGREWMRSARFARDPSDYNAS
ncbi:MAG: IS21 family transposase [Planctomycetota bacterium]